MKPNPIALVVDHDKASRRWLRQLLEAQHYRAFETENGSSAAAAAQLWQPDVVILEWLLPEPTGQAVLEQLRACSRSAVLVLSSCDQEEEIVAALDAGASDYLLKPFGESELLARLRVLQRALPGECHEPFFERDGIRIDTLAHRISVNDCCVALTPTEAALFHTLLSYSGQVVGSRHLLRSVWGAEGEEQGHYLRVFISGLRRKLQPAQEHVVIETVGSCGYRVRALNSTAASGVLCE